MKVNEIMVKEVATLDVNDELSLANDIMRLGRIRHLPVVDNAARCTGCRWCELHCPDFAICVREVENQEVKSGEAD